MTQDVRRLHQEKQVIEQQIADLFGFYSKQKQEAEVRLAYAGPRRNTLLAFLSHRILHAATHLRSQLGLVTCKIYPRRLRSDRGGHYPILFSREGIEAMACWETAGWVRM